MAFVRQLGGWSYPWLHFHTPLNVNGGAGGSGMITVELDPATAGTLTVVEAQVLTGFTISAGALYAKIKNLGSLIEGGTDADITVGGQTLGIGEEREYHAILDPVTNTYKKVPALVVVNASGAGVWYHHDR